MGGLFLLSRRQGGGMGPGGPGNPMAFGKSKARFQMEPNTGALGVLRALRCAACVLPTSAAPPVLVSGRPGSCSLQAPAAHQCSSSLYQSAGSSQPCDRLAMTTPRCARPSPAGITFADVAGVDEAKQDFQEVRGSFRQCFGCPIRRLSFGVAALVF